MADGEDDKINRRELLSQQLDAEAEEAEHGPAPDLNIHPDSYERGRDESGKFVSRETSSKATPAESRQDTTLVVDAAPKEPAVWERPPKSWKKDFHEVWGTIRSQGPRIYRPARKRDVGPIQRTWPKAKLADSITAVAEPYMNTIRGLGVDLPTAVKGLMQADHVLRTSAPEQKRAYLVQLARNYGIDLGPSRQLASKPRRVRTRTIMPFRTNFCSSGAILPRSNSSKSRPSRPTHLPMLTLLLHLTTISRNCVPPSPG